MSRRRRWRTARLLAAAALATCAALAAGTPGPAAPGAGDPWLLYVANAESDSVSVIDTTTRAVVGTIPVGDSPGRVAISPDSTAAYVTNEGDGTVTVIDTFTNAVADTAGTATATAAGAPVATVTTPDGATSYVAKPDHDRLDVVDTATSAVVATISGVGDGPCGLAISPDGATVYVANAGSGTVSLVDTTTNSVLGAVAVGGRPAGLAVTPDQPPVAALAVTPALTGHPTTLDAAESTVRFGTITTYTWDFGDGTTATTTVPTTTHTYTAAGRYPVTLTLTSSGGTSTARVSSGRTVIRNGGQQARTVRAVTIPGSAPGDGGGLPITGPGVALAAVIGLLATVLGGVLVVSHHLAGRIASQWSRSAGSRRKAFASRNGAVAR